ncbi:MAG: bifunctional aspartokinase / homoserine dehydrogenase ThrA [Oceanicaulis sp. HLUCCA04]|nr:MAG: bifunctional aspartokinase / homoserine dehydrogenase ThrA [Oceanicaulis sp. HLUCCA04]
MKSDSLNSASAPLCVLKFGSSVLKCEADYDAAAQEVFRHVRRGEKVIAVVSALAGETDALLAQGKMVGGSGSTPNAAMLARLARTGELRSAALMGLALARVGMRTAVLDPHEISLEAEGDPLDSNLCGLDSGAVAEALAGHEVLAVPGFTATHARHGVVTLGRGGTDLTAVFFAARCGAPVVRLIKDVDGVYAQDPAENPDAERYAELDYDAAASASAGLIQPKAIAAAKAAGIIVEVAAMGAADATRICSSPARKAPARQSRPLRVALLGCGAVGAGVLAHLRSRPDLFEMNPVLVRHPQARAHVHGVTFTSQLEHALAHQPDLVVELLGGADAPAEIMAGALAAGAHVVTANKAALARHYDDLYAAARDGDARLAWSAAVGGGTPVLEAVERLCLAGGVVKIEGVMNGTANFLLDRLANGEGFAEAVGEAQRLGFAEADPAADVDGHDAADKLSLLIRQAFGQALSPAHIAKDSLADVSPAAVQGARSDGLVFKQIGVCELLDGGGVRAEVRVRPVPVHHPLAGARNEENRFILTGTGQGVQTLYGKGAGRWPTAAAVFADIMDIQRGLSEPVNVKHATSERSTAPARLRA